MIRQRWKRAAAVVAAVLLACLVFAATAFGFGPGARGADVYAVQAMLASMGYYGGAIDGAYGPKTAGGVSSYQQEANLAVTGDVDAATLRSIMQAYLRSKTASNAAGQAGGAGGGNGANASAHALSGDEQTMVSLVNAARAEANLPPLAVHTDLSRVARIKSDDMAAHQYFSHDSPTYGSPFQMMQDFGISYMAAGENIACNQTVERAHDALMNSPGHRANILSADFTHIGVGIVNGGQCGAMYTQMFLKP